MVITYKAVGGKSNKTTLCAEFTLRRRTAEESEKRGRESWGVGGLRGGAAVTGEQWSRESKGKKRGIQVSVVDYTCWAGHFDLSLVCRENETLGEKGQLSDRWIKKKKRESESTREELQSDMINCNWLS